MEQMEWMQEVEMEEEMREVVEEKSMAEAGRVDAAVKEVELHPSWRRWARSTSPQMTSPDDPQIQEVAWEGGEEGEMVEGPSRTPRGQGR